MALVNITPLPAGVAPAFVEGLLKLLSGLAPVVGGLAGTLQQNFQTHFIGSPPALPSAAELGLSGIESPGYNPQQIYVLSLADLANNADPHPAGWQLFVGRQQGKTLLCHVTQSTQGSWELAACLYGDRVWDTLQGSLALANLPAVQKANYEVRLLAIRALNLEAFWLVANPPGSGDLVVPFQALNKSVSALNASGAVTMETFRSAIRKLVWPGTASQQTES